MNDMATLADFLSGFSAATIDVDEHGHGNGSELLTNLNDLSWRDIEQVGLSGEARSTFALGATKTEIMTDGYAAEFQIIGFDHDDLGDGTGKAPISWDLVRVYEQEHEMNSNGRNIGGWSCCDMNVWLNVDLFSNLSFELQEIIKPVIKLTSVGGGSVEIDHCISKLWLKSERELYGRCFYSVPGEGRWYDFYRQEDVPYYKERDNGQKAFHWLRSPYCYSSYSFCSVDASGSSGYDPATYSGGVSPGFCC